MSRRLFMIWTLGCAMLVTSVVMYELWPSAEVKKQAKIAENRKRGDQLAASIKYFYDGRTGLTYAYMSESLGFGGGPALTLVPFDKVKDYLLNPPEKPPQ